MDATDSSFFATGIYGVVKVLSCLIFLVFVADSLGRRRSLLITAVAQGLVFFVIAVYGRVQPPIKGQPVCFIPPFAELPLLICGQLGYTFWLRGHYLYLSLGCVSVCLFLLFNHVADSSL